MSAIILPVIRISNVSKKELFLQRLAEVESRHIDWFKNRPAIFDNQEHDSIANHTFSEGDSDSFSFNFWKHSELPETIKAECLLAFEDVFGKKSVA